MQLIDSEEYWVDLKWPELLPIIQQPVQSLVATEVETSRDSDNEQTFQLTGWRGAGWRMVFLEEAAR